MLLYMWHKYKTILFNLQSPGYILFFLDNKKNKINKSNSIGIMCKQHENKKKGNLNHGFSYFVRINIKFNLKKLLTFVMRKRCQGGGCGRDTLSTPMLEQGVNHCQTVLI